MSLLWCLKRSKGKNLDLKLLLKKVKGGISARLLTPLDQEVFKMALAGSQTEKNLREAFAGESQANRRYLAFAKKAEEEGFKQVAKLFRAAAEAETVHAHAHLRALGGIKSTKENIQEAIAGESDEFKKMYPEMLAKAKAEGIKPAEVSFDYANQVEKIHAALYEKAMAELGKNKAVDYYVCPVCGNTVEEKAPAKCPICGTAGSKFIRVS
jgi:rubrerythrin